MTIARACEEVLLAARQSDEAYRRYAIAANQAGTHLATYRAVKKKYPDKAPRTVLDDLIASTPDDPGRWFATAKTLGFLDLATDLARQSAVDIGTLLRAARDHLGTHPAFALDAATAALHWMAKGQCYEIKAGDVWQAASVALQAAALTGALEPTQALISRLAAHTDTDPFVRTHLLASL
ncbi:hypothetical protein [uncultured Thiodictyon sp.]|uniref:hypothetical protein n=1 Tax=uncultured Thiodictyon sp. TaxID=1846217 RepID=UPI0025FD2EFF|nr:hypothetical protein [uncultured Thiodictyon sp.]